MTYLILFAFVFKDLFLIMQNGNAEILRLLDSSSSQSGNFLLNVSPDREGTKPIEQIEILNQVGKWMEINGRAIYGAGPSPVELTFDGEPKGTEPAYR
jgi:alpha-L-fucosidase